MIPHEREPTCDELLDMLGGLSQHDVDPQRAEHIGALARRRLARHRRAPRWCPSIRRLYPAVFEPALVSTLVVVHLAWLATHLLP